MYANFLLVFRARTSRIIIWFPLQPCHILLMSPVLNATPTLPADMNSSTLPSAAADPALYANRYHTLMAGVTVLLVLPTLAVILRLLSRWIAGAGLWFDDYAVILAWLFALGPSIALIVAIHIGFGEHIEILPASTIFAVFKVLYAFSLTFIMAMITVKFSVILFLYRIFPIVHFRRILVGAAIFVVCLGVSLFPVSIWTCTPIHDFWTTLGGGVKSRSGGRCVNTQLFYLVSGAINTVTDFALLALPIPLLWRLRTGKLQKSILTVIFTVGLTVCAVSINRLIILSRFQHAKLSQLGRLDITWNYVAPATWTAAEPAVAVISACLPSLRPLFVRNHLGPSLPANPDVSAEQ
ncbi:hypothetical protein HO173_010415 [Letharia columbiana]|uniref:Rhodopsin domain-containing protein n=1 Tax=Letharia columbiana TaxID=112416 RepID=A0A8H6FMW2_9LECA|nr:uncharacterized protein HO173_010415 [Letharia columbiana]KAF6231454.1 hypothetical protein HO173_010415 [Letharia columbiana]